MIFADGGKRWIVGPDTLSLGAQSSAYAWTNKNAAEFYVAQMQHAAPSFCALKVEELN